MDSIFYHSSFPHLISFSKEPNNDQLIMQNLNHHHHHHQIPKNSSATSRSESDETATSSTATEKWAASLLRDCAKAASDNDSDKFHHILWMLNELATPYGDLEQKIASHFLQALFCKAAGTGDHCYKAQTTAAERTHSFQAARKVMLKFQEVSPWMTFGHVASNGAILEALEGEAKLHIVDISNSYCTQWPTLLEALATRMDETLHLRLTVVATKAMANASVIKEAGQRMERFARLMGVPFEFRAVDMSGKPGDLKESELDLREGEAVAVTCSGTLRRIDPDERDAFVSMLKALRPRVVTVVEEEADFTSNRDDFAKCFEDCLRFYTLFFDMLEESFGPTSNERLVIERECSRSIVSVLACDGGGDSERRERGSQWCERMMAVFSPAGFSDDVIGDVAGLLKRYRTGWSYVPGGGEGGSAGIYLTWKDEPVVWASAWKL